METQSNIRSWDDLIFENRNKAYGAYALRQDYSSGLLKGVFAAGIALGCFILATGFSNKGNNRGVPPINDTITLTHEPFKIEKNQVKPPAQERRNPQTRSEDPQVQVVTHDPVEAPKPDEPTTTTTNTSSEPGTDSGVDTGSPQGTGIEPAPAEDMGNKTFSHVQVMPAYKGGYEAMMRFILKKVKYPASSYRMKNQGTVYVEFVVNAQGKVANVKVIRGVDQACDQEASRVIALLDQWSPGYQNNIPVNVKMVLPVKFQIEEL